MRRAHDARDAVAPDHDGHAVGGVRRGFRLRRHRKPADETCGGTRVVPGNPGASYLMQKLTRDPPCDGLHMPRAFEIIAPPPLTSAELGAISRWISAGAGP